MHKLMEFCSLVGYLCALFLSKPILQTLKHTLAFQMNYISNLILAIKNNDNQKDNNEHTYLKRDSLMK